jgi:hypothetical protein
MSEKKLNLSTRLVAQCTIEFDCGSEYGGSWTFEDAYKDAHRAAQNIAQRIAQEQKGIVAIKIDGIRSVTTERP